MISTAKTQHTEGLKRKEVRTFPVEKIEKDSKRREKDLVVIEAPLEIIIVTGKESDRRSEVLSVTMRTPGEDFNLVRGFLFAEHIITACSDIQSIYFKSNTPGENTENVIVVELLPGVIVNLSEKKNFITNSACGFCGRNAFDQSLNAGMSFESGDKVLAKILYQLPHLLRNSQGLFEETGGTHAVALINFNGDIEQIYEDVGRHNAMDKLIGDMLHEEEIPLKNKMVLFSGRMSYELVQKSLAAGIPIICSIGAPTSLAIELAEAHNMTLVGFLKKDRMNIYAGGERVEEGSGEW